ncbi:MAG: hypothetical protein J6S85_23955 [Methanobrevibacter sp.]|nr:hypothetical protein [Methanobrevibacter sp.]
MKKILFGIYFLGLMLLVMTLLEFIYLDKKLTRAIDTQMEVNASLKTTQNRQERTIRLLETDCSVLTNIIINGDYLDE